MQHAEVSHCNSSRLLSNSEVVKEELTEEQSERGNKDEGRLLLLQKTLEENEKNLDVTAEAGCIFFFLIQPAIDVF